jgi:predicted Zn finger-like uncharacterized protein
MCHHRGTWSIFHAQPEQRGVTLPCPAQEPLTEVQMIAICEECAKKYNIDESKIKSDRARFSCVECGHIIVVEKKKAPLAHTGAPTPSRSRKDE